MIKKAFEYIPFVFMQKDLKCVVQDELNLEILSYTGNLSPPPQKKKNQKVMISQKNLN